MNVAETYQVKENPEDTTKAVVDLIRENPVLVTGGAALILLVGRFAPYYVLGILLALIFLLPRGYDFVKSM